MSLFASPKEHAANPPETWRVERSPTNYQPWRLVTKDGTMLTGLLDTRREAERLKTEGFYVTLYRDEGRWYAGENVRNWKPYAKT